MSDFIQSEFDRIAAHLAELKKLSWASKVPCLICGGSADPQCGCDGTMRVHEARRYLNEQIEILNK